MIAAIYVLPDGPYAGREDVDLWPESRDARLYAGPRACVSHPREERLAAGRAGRCQAFRRQSWRQRTLTPVPFAEFLLAIARLASPPELPSCP